MTDASNDIVVVTGAGSGIGQATALEFATHGYTVVAVGRRSERLRETVVQSEPLAGRVIDVAGDVGNPEDVAKITQRACSEGRYAILVNNAGVGWQFGVDRPGSMAALRETSLDNWREVMRINLDSVYMMCHAALQHFASGASIVNVSSAGGVRGMNDAHTYATTKAGIINLTRSLAKTYGPEGIRANVVAPGFVATEMVSPVLDSPHNPFADERMRFQVNPLGRPGTAEEIATAIYFMAVQATYCNGSVLVADGGSLA
ncbi:MAG TPA: SDR family oxidoreductase [Pseudomonadales bacterium]|nr:SDR family oxidoreductase [Pseudomonadales bacterium]